MPSPDTERLTGQLRGVLEPVVTAAGFELDAVEVRAAGRRHAVTVVVDRPDDAPTENVGLDDVAQLSRSAAAELDGHEHLIGGSYTLEVTSPGVDRPLTRPRHWRRAWLRLASIRLTDGSELTARVGRADDDGVRVATTGKRPELRDLGYGEIAGARVEVEFRDPPKAEVALLDPSSGTSANGEEDR
ncbi:ribosome maturation factor RimP [Pseudonocardia endophytica]|uniref:Ribosome maturation factor RimP n=1 Tax=Pseudonocardia endophytica TaxID=401976 RepID=A0A4R1HZ19_PSEEN|nr:ribosome maturation factor RimP [Pseudonocardia endophytica]TCK25359.1 ribosome maturation factor RimP [Pseudonocardia endophytica]